MAQPSVLLIPGSFCKPSFYENITTPLQSDGIDITAIHLPTVGPSGQTGYPGPAPSMYDDAAFIASAISKLVDAGKDVILIAHSYGGIPVSESIKGLSRKERISGGKTGGVVRIAYMTALVPGLGGHAAGLMADLPSESVLSLPVDVSVCPF